MLTPTTLPIQDRLPGAPAESDTEDTLLTDTPGEHESTASSRPHEDPWLQLAAAKGCAAARTSYTGRIRDSSKCSARTPWYAPMPGMVMVIPPASAPRWNSRIAGQSSQRKQPSPSTHTGVS